MIGGSRQFGSGLLISRDVVLDLVDDVCASAAFFDNAQKDEARICRSTSVSIRDLVLMSPQQSGTPEGTLSPPTVDSNTSSSLSQISATATPPLSSQTPRRGSSVSSSSGTVEAPTPPSSTSSEGVCSPAATGGSYHMVGRSPRSQLSSPSTRDWSYAVRLLDEVDRSAPVSRISNKCIFESPTLPPVFNSARGPPACSHYSPSNPTSQPHDRDSESPPSLPHRANAKHESHTPPTAPTSSPSSLQNNSRPSLHSTASPGPRKDHPQPNSSERVSAHVAVPIPPLVSIVSPPRQRMWYQFQVHEQFHRMACGYFALHNAFVVVRALQRGNTSLQQAVSALSFLRRPASSHLFIRKMMRSLLAEAERRSVAHKSYWSKEEIASMELARTHMDFLIKNNELMLALGGPTTFTSLPSISLRELRSAVMTPAQAGLVQSVLDPFRVSKRRFHAFVIGNGDHWIAVVMNKLEDKIELVYMDSYNFGVLSPTNLELLQKSRDIHHENVPRYIAKIRNDDPYFGKFSDAMMAEVLQNGNQFPHYVASVPSRIVRSYGRWLDARYALTALESVASGDQQFATMYLDALVEGVVHNFNEMLEEDEPNESVDSASAPNINDDVDLTLTAEQTIARQLMAEISGANLVAARSDDESNVGDEKINVGDEPLIEVVSVVADTETPPPLSPEEKFARWLRGNGELCHPAFVRDGLVKKLRVFGVHQLSAYSRERLTRWMTSFKAAGDEFFQRTYDEAVVVVLPSQLRLYRRMCKHIDCLVSLLDAHDALLLEEKEGERDVKTRTPSHDKTKKLAAL